MWILPKQLQSTTSPSVRATGESISPSPEWCEACAQSLLAKSKRSPARIWLQRWKRDSWTRLLSGMISSPSLGNAFTDSWTSSLAASRVSPQEPSSLPTEDTLPLSPCVLEIVSSPTTGDGAKSLPLCISQTLLSDEWQLKACPESLPQTNTPSSPEKEGRYQDMLTTERDSQEGPSLNPSGLKPKTSLDVLCLRFSHVSERSKTNTLLTSGGSLAGISQRDGESKDSIEAATAEGSYCAATSRPKQRCSPNESREQDSTSLSSLTERQPSSTLSTEGSIASFASSAKEPKESYSPDSFLSLFNPSQKPSCRATSQETVVGIAPAEVGKDTALAPSVSHLLLVSLSLPSAFLELLPPSGYVSLKSVNSSKGAWSTNGTSTKSVSLIGIVRPLSREIMVGSSSASPSLVAEVRCSTLPLRETRATLQTEPLSITANPSLPPANGAATKTLGTSSLTSCAASHPADQASSSLRTSKALSVPSSKETVGTTPQERPFYSMSLENWKGWVIGQRQEYSARVKSERAINVNESSSLAWPTPRAEERCQKNSQDDYVSLGVAAKNWPTPCTMDTLPPKDQAALDQARTKGGCGNLREWVHHNGTFVYSDHFHPDPASGGGNRQEFWKEVPGFNQQYQVSSHGRLRSQKSGKWKLMATSIKDTGYPIASLRLGGRKGTQKKIPIHILVAALFIGKRPEGMMIDHLDGNKQNPSIWNLEYVTPMENCHRAIKMGLMTVSGESNPMSKLTELQVTEIRNKLSLGTTQKALAREYGLTPSGIQRIASGKTWSPLSLTKTLAPQWATPRTCSAMAATITPESVWDESRFPNLETQVGQVQWGTPRSQMGGNTVDMGKASLEEQIHNWATPQARDWKGQQGRAYKDEAKDLPAQTEGAKTLKKGQLNPDWVCALMGLPIGWVRP